jgi:hypothetical protein
MTTSPTEQEIVARAINDVLPVRFQRGDAQKEHQLADCIPFAQAAISALDQYRAKNAGGVEHMLRYIDAYNCEYEPHVVLPWLEKAANLISSMRAVIEEKDRALELANIAIAEVETEAGLSHGRPSDNFDKGAAAARSFFGDIIRRYRARSTISDGVK